MISSENTARFLHLALANELNEHFSALFLNSSNQVLAFEHLFHGTINSTEVHPRVVVQRALAHNAAAVIVAHNHPSNNPEPSKADILITQQLKDILAILNITLLDHFIVTRNNCVSLSERGLM
jgi:DNA repair protein RadC